jgi:hypothetical protein
VANKNSIFNYEQQFYLSGILLSGVTDIAGGYSIEESPINIIGHGYTYPAAQGPMVGNFSISKYFIGEDPILNYTGNHSISGSINYGDKSFGFESGYLNEYSFSANIGSIPQSQANIVVYGDIGSGIDASGSNSHPEIQIANQGSISLDVEGYQTNRITSFAYNLRIDRSPVYKIGSPFPVQVDTSFPIVQEVSLVLEVSDFELNTMNKHLIKPTQQDINISINNPINETNIETFTVKKARLSNSSLQSTTSDSMTFNLQYIGYINKK